MSSADRPGFEDPEAADRVDFRNAGPPPNSATAADPQAADVARVTVLQSDGPRANKMITRNRDGTITKSGAVMGGRYNASTYPAPDAETLAGILHNVASDPRMVLSLGTFTGLEPGEVFRVLPANELAKRLGVEKGDAIGIRDLARHPTAARLKANMEPGGWILFDRDITPGMPDELARLSCDQWLETMCLLLPGLDRADRVLVPSTTGRVLVDGHPMEAAGWHLFVRVDDPEDMTDRVWAQMLIKAHATTFRGVSLGFMKPMFARDGSGRIVGRTAWSVYDPTTIGRERLVYDGQPMVRGKGLSLANPAIEAFPGEPWSTRSFADLDPSVEERFEREHGLKLERTGGNSSGKVRELSLVSEDLSLDLEVETEAGWKTIRELRDGEDDHVRCQTPFRHSGSWAAYVGRHSDGSPFLFDVGPRIKCVLPYAERFTVPPGAPPPQQPPGGGLAYDPPPWEGPLDRPMFHGPLGDVVRILDPDTEADPKAVMLCLLTAAGNQLGRRYYAGLGADKHFATIHALLLGDSALGRKGTAANLALQAAKGIDPDWHEFNIRRSINSGEGIGHVVMTIDARAKERVEQQSGMSNPPGDKRACFILEEFGETLRKASGPTSSILPYLRRAWDGGALENNSLTHPLRVTKASVAIIAMITGAELVDLMDPRQLATGSWNRWVTLDVHRTKKLRKPPVIDITAKTSRIAAEIRRNAQQAGRRSMPRTDGIEIPMSLAPDADDLMADIKDALEKAMETRTWLAAGKARGYVQVLRLALIYSVMDGAPAIEVPHVEAAKDLVGLSIATMESSQTKELGDPIAERVITGLNEAPAQALTRAEISAVILNKHCPADKLEHAIGTLLKLGMVRSEVVPTKGRPKTVIALTAEGLRT